MDNNVLIWSQVLDWVPPSMSNFKDVRMILELMIPKVQFRRVHYTLGALSQIIHDGFPKHNILDAVDRICPMMRDIIICMMVKIHDMPEHPDIDQDEF